MANIWGRLFGSRNLSNEVANMRNSLADLANTNATLQQLLNISFRNQGGYARYDTINQIGFVRDGYNISSAVYSIVSDIAQKAAAIPLKNYKVVDEFALKNYKIASSLPRTPENVYWTTKLRTKALEQVDPYNDPLQKLLDRPNADDDPVTFWQTVTGFRLLCGNSFMYCPVVDYGLDKGRITELRIMPSPFTALIIVQGFPTRVIGYELIIDGVRLLKSEEVIHIKYPNYDWSIDGQQLYGLPPLKAAFKTLQRSNSAETSSTAMFENGGPGIIIANKSLPSDKIGLEQASKIKKTWNDEYAGNTNRGKVKLMAGDISAIPLGLSPVDLNILESEKWSFDMLCNVFHVSSVMFNNHDGNTESNVKEMRKDSWTRAVLPERKAHADAINRMIVPSYNTAKAKYFVDMDISGITELQPDMSTMTTWLGGAWWVNPNEKRKLQDFDAIADPNMDKIWMPSGYQLMDDAVMPDVTQIPDMPTNDNNADT